MDLAIQQLQKGLRQLGMVNNPVVNFGNVHLVVLQGMESVLEVLDDTSQKMAFLQKRIAEGLEGFYRPQVGVDTAFIHGPNNSMYVIQACNPKRSTMTWKEATDFSKEFCEHFGEMWLCNAPGTNSLH